LFVARTGIEPVLQE